MQENKSKTKWVGSWSSSAASAGIHIPPLIHLNNGLLYSTARSVIRPTLGGDRIRLKISNRFNKKPLHISETTVANHIGGKADTDKPVNVTFGGKKEITLAPGEETLSDTIDFKVETLSFDKETMTYDMARIRNQFAEKKPNWVIISHASNICGVVSPIKELFRLSKEFGAINIVDMCQTAGLVDTDLSGDDIDFAVFAGHKTLYSPLGVAGIVSSFAIKPQPLLFGGTGFESANQALPESVPERYEVASPDIAAIAGLNASLKWIKETGIQNIFEKEQANHKKMLEILSRYENIKVIDTAKAMSIGVVSCLFDGYGSDSIGQILSEQGVAVRTGLHCAPTAHKFIGTFPAGTVRFSVSYFNTEEDFEILEAALDYIELNS